MNGDSLLEQSYDIAIIGYAARLPGAPDAAQFWDNLSNGVESIRTFSAAQLASVGVSAAHLNDPHYVRAGASLAHLDAFDASFFGINPHEAAIMDPQQRFFMESAWEALEHAGYAPGNFAGSIGVFAGSGANSYLIYNLLTNAELVEKDGIFLLRHTGNDKDVLATRVSYQMNLRGPSVNVQTACSTSLVAVHLACQSLLQMGCDMALAGAVSIEIPHATGYLYRQNEIQAQDGHCRAFDAKATGTVFGSGLGIAVLKRLPDAIAAGDTIHAVIKGSAINNDGNRKVGFLAPSMEGQIAVISEALALADVTADSIDYVETHGTGTPIGDPIELAALSQVFAGRDRELKIGSVKTNIGHLDTAAGMAGLLKTVLALKHRQIPATLHFQKLNPLVDAAKAKFEVVAQLENWKSGDGPRRAGVTSLGIGGTNAHVILEEAPVVEPGHPGRPAQLYTLSAKSSSALEDATRRLAQHLRHAPDENPDDMAYTLHLGRSEFAQRRAFVARDHDEALQLADLPHSANVATGKTGDPLQAAFLFSGQGSQFCGMGRQLHESEPVFTKWIATCASLARPHLGFDFRDILYPAKGTETEAAKLLKATWNAQPILFALEYALAQLWISWGIRPTSLLGHSLGEYTAACLSGVFTLEDAIALVCARGNLMKKVSEGAMLAVAQSEAEIAPLITGMLTLAAVNGPAQCVVSGPTADILALKEQLKKQGIPSHRLDTSHAFHSKSIDPVVDLFVDLVKKAKLSAPQIPIVSNVTGAWLTEKEATDPAYWGRHFRATVQFAKGLDLLRTDAGCFLIEIGPGDTLCSLSKQCGSKEARLRSVNSLPRAEGAGDDITTLFSSLGTLWVHGAPVDWKAFHAQEKRRRVPLPTYPFQRKNFWMGPRNGSNFISDALDSVDDWFYRPVWKSTPLSDHAAGTGSLLVLCDPATESPIIGELRKQGVQVFAVFAGDKFQVLSGDSCTMNLSAENDYVLLLDHLVKQNRVPRALAHLWSLSTDELAEDRCFHSLVYLLKAWGARLPEHPLALTAFSQRAVSVRGERVLQPYGSLLAGPCRVAPLEYPNIRCRQVDIDTLDPQILARIIHDESAVEKNVDASTSLVAYREGSRWTEDVERFRLEPAADRLRERGTYVITGGLGGLGLAVAESLAKSHHARLVLLSRHADLPAPANEVRFNEWRRLGAEVVVCQADVTDRDSLAAALTIAREKFGRINGVIHAAGTINDGIIQLKSKDASRGVLAPKVEGLQILEELTRGDSLDFFALFSSVSALTPPAGQVDYCAANAFLNAFAQSRPAGSNFLVIGWKRWTEIGLAASKPAPASTPAPFDHPLLDRVESDTPSRTVYSGTLSVERNWVLAEHRFKGGASLLPGTAHLDIAVTALWKKIGAQPIILEDVFFLAPLRVAAGSPCVVEAQLQKADAGYLFSVVANDVTYVSGRCLPALSSALLPRMDVKAIMARCTADKKEAPVNVRQRGHFDFGPHWQSLREIAFGRDECLATVELPAEFRAETGVFSVHPALMDIATGVAMYLLPGYDKAGDLLLPFAYKRLTLYTTLPARVYSHARLRHDTGTEMVIFDITLADEKGAIIAEIEEFTVKRLRSSAELSAPEIPAAPLAARRNAFVAMDGIPTREGLEAFQRLLKTHPTDIVFVSPMSPSPVVAEKQQPPASLPITASGDDIERVLRQLWQQLLGLDEVDASTDFFDSGGHSLLAVRLFTEIRKRFAIDLGLSTLFEARTLGALADLIRQQRDQTPSEKNNAAIPGIVPIRQRTSSKTPLFLIHDVGGSVLRYESLAKQFPDNQPIYAIESRGLNGRRTDFSVNTMARHYIAQIREQQSQGPYFVAGHSFGGLVAYEIARQLTAQNETMGLVGLIDTYQWSRNEEDKTPTTVVPRVGKLPFFQRLTTDLRAMLWGRDRIGYILERQTFVRAWAIKTLYRTVYGIVSKVGLRMPRFLNDVKEANWIASDYFTPREYTGEVVLFRCENRLDTDPADSSRVWLRLTGGRVVILDVPGDHNSMLREPGVRVLAEQMLAYLQPEKAAVTETSKS
jgi:acyl transferase domain-containing protein/thioesterase domain-containing protein/acyl carrier protein